MTSCPPVQDLAQRRLPLVATLVGTVVLVPAAVGVDRQHLSAGWALLGYLSLASFLVAFHILATRTIAARRRGVPPAALPRRAGFLLLCVPAGLVVALAGEHGVVMWFALSQVAMVLLPRREAWGVTGSIAFTVAFVPWSLELDWAVNVWFLVAILGSAWATDSIFRLRDTNQRLARAQEEIASMAVERERLRFARDLHDILGHSLTAATVKTQLARRTVGGDDDRVRAELREVEMLLRESLGDVRGAVAGYRDVTLAGELVRAATMLEAAGLEAALPDAVDVVPAERRELFGWVLREAVTNIVRHSRATRCLVSVDAGRIEVWNDGVNTPARHSGARAGSGLAGLRERVGAAAGTFEAGPDGDGGWRVVASVDPVRPG